MKATLREYGGPMDPTGRRAQVVDTTSITKVMADELIRLVAEAKAQRPVPDISEGKGRDTMTYTITIEEDGQPIVLKQSDMTRTPAFLKLQDWLKLNGSRT